MMPMFLRDLGRNVAFGARVPFGLPVKLLDFRIGVTQLLALFVFSALVDLAVDWLQREPDALFTMQGLVGEMFFGAVLMLRPIEDAAVEEREVQAEIADLPRAPSALRVVTTSFLVLFLAEWGDLTQLLTASLSAKYHQPLSVFLGSSLGLIAVAGLGVTGGKALLRVVPMQWVRRIAAVAFGVVAVVTALQAANVL